MAEDDEEDQMLVIRAFRESRVANGIEIVEDGEQLMDYLLQRPPYTKAKRPDLILLDLNMPRKDGREVLGHLQNDDGFKTIPVVVLTTSASEDDVAYCYRNGANSFVCKPATFRAWIETIRTLCSYWFQLVNLPSN